jgi:hypothetical protein
MAFQKTGYQNSLEFDPTSGIIKYGNYEFFANQVGERGPSRTFTYDDFRNTQGAGSRIYNTEAKMREAFDQAAQALAGGYIGNPPSKTGNAIVDNSPRGRAQYSAAFQSVNKVDNNTYQIDTYNIPSNVEFIEKLNKQATNLQQNAAVGQETDPSRPRPGNSRLGKPNYSRAATVLSNDTNALGGASAVLGS